MSEIIYGRNAVREALRAGAPINKLVLARGITPRVRREISALARRQKVPVTEADRARLDTLASGAAHQGLVAVMAGHAYVSVDEMLTGAGADTAPLVLVLNEIQDPHNLGAILRTAEAGGCTGAVIPTRRAAGITPAVVKASSGAVSHLPVARVVNVARTLRHLKDRGFWVVGADQDGERVYWDADLTGPLVLVVGGEDAGLGRVVRAQCDFLVRLPMFGRVGSLNASVAAALFIYEALRQRRPGKP